MDSLSEESRADVDRRIANGESSEKLADLYKTRYNEYLANYSEPRKEKKVLGALITTKGA